MDNETTIVQLTYYSPNVGQLLQLAFLFFQVHRAMKISTPGIFLCTLLSDQVANGVEILQRFVVISQLCLTVQHNWQERR
jgi:hypothetical protein